MLPRRRRPVGFDHALVHMALGSILCACILFLTCTASFDSLARVAVRVVIRDWLEAPKPSGPVAHLRGDGVADGGTGARVEQGADTHQAAVSLQRLRCEADDARSLTILAEDGVVTQQIVSIVEDAASAGFDEVLVWLDPEGEAEPVGLASTRDE